MIRFCMFLCITLGVLSGCSNDSLPPGDRAGGVMFSDSVLREKMLSAFEENNIPVEIDQRGFVNFLLKDQSKVLGIIRDIKFGGDLNSNYYESVVVHSEKVKNKYVFEFEKQKIPFDIIKYDGEDQISWSQKYGPEVDKIQQKINMEFRREGREKAVKEGRAPASLVDRMDN